MPHPLPLSRRSGSSAPSRPESAPLQRWPAHAQVVVPWRSSARGPRADRMLREITASLPPRIAAAEWSPDAGTEQLLAHAAHALRTVDAEHGHVLFGLSSIMVRTEAVASSRIEHEHATLDDLARASVGGRANPSATTVARAGAALERLAASAADGAVTEAALLAAHRALMADDPVDARYAGRYRDVQNWIGGGPTPRLATYVPPPAAAVPELMEDLLAFVHRDDLHPIAQAALAHAQFESIHPFTDGNGRIGRALVAAVLRRRGLGIRVKAPVAVVLAAERARYFGRLAAYRDGDVDDLVRDLAIAIGTVCDEATLSALVLREHRAWLDTLGLPPALVGVLARESSVSEDTLDGLLDDRVDAVVRRLCGAGVLRSLTERRRRRVWRVEGVAAEFEAFTARVTDAVLARAGRAA
ncbi:Fic family protein [Curtobacterium sp. 458]|uniref:Fic family protein n=1 Tax=Curtobacterium sp. 458 TaxID=3050069 RepID=UPI0025B5E359|nr:Fic family protein [Curtobacterium sp. 458]WJX99991.1 Fic family protein [Curtobacterium sp. 458]